MGGRLLGPDCLGNVGKPFALQPRRQPARDPASDARAFIDHRRIELDEARPGADALPRIVGILDPADADQRNLAAARAAEFAQRIERERLQRPPESPPASPAWRDLSGGREIVVFETMIASIP